MNCDNWEVCRNSYLLYGEMAASGLLSSGKKGDFNYVSAPGSAWPEIIYSETCIPTEYLLGLQTVAEGIKQKTLPRLIILNEEVVTSAVALELAAFRFLPATRWVNMCLDVCTDASIVIPEGTEFRILKPFDIGGRQEWMAIAEQVLFPKTKLDEGLLEYIISNDICRLVVADYNGRPAATTMLYKGETAGIYMVATLPEYRGRGIGRAIMQFTQSLAAGLNYRHITLQSTPAGQKLYEAMGYKSLGKMFLYYCML